MYELLAAYTLAAILIEAALYLICKPERSQRK